MMNPNDQSDERTDRNLRLLAEHLRLPLEPTDLQLARWKQGDRRKRTSSLIRGVQLMRKHRHATLAGAGALAATIALTTMLLFPFGGTPVEAKTIFTSLRQSLGNAFTVTFDDIGDDGVRVNGKLIAVYEKDAQTTVPFEAPVRALYLEADIQADETNRDVAGLNVEVRGSAVREPADAWVYVKLNQMPPKIIQEQPLAIIIQQFTQNGLLLELDTLLEEDELQEVFEDLSIDLELQNDGAKRSVNFGAGIKANEETPAPPVDPEAELEQLPLKILTGQLTQADIDQIVSLLEEEAITVTVVEQEPGFHVLTARDFPPEPGEPWMVNMVLTIAYREGYGVPWASLQHVGPYDGNIRVEMTEVALDDKIFSSQQYYQDGVTKVIDVGAIKDLAEALGAEFD